MNIFESTIMWLENYKVDTTKYKIVKESNETGLFIRFYDLNRIEPEFEILIDSSGKLNGRRAKGISKPAGEFANKLINFADSL